MRALPDSPPNLLEQCFGGIIKSSIVIYRSSFEKGNSAYRISISFLVLYILAQSLQFFQNDQAFSLIERQRQEPTYLTEPILWGGLCDSFLLTKLWLFCNLSYINYANSLSERTK